MDGKDTVIVISDDSDSEEISTLVVPPINVSTNKLGQGVAPPNNLHGSSSLATSATHGSLIPPVIPAVVASNTPSTPSLVKKSKTSSTTTRVVNHQIDSRNQGKQPFINHSTSFKPVVGPRDNAIDMHNAQEAASVAASVSDLPSIVQGKSWDSISVRTLARYTLQKVFGFPYFRGFQELIIQAALAPGEPDIFATMPTGGGKSLCYVLPALLRPGLTVVVSPLLSLIQDQVEALVHGRASRTRVRIPAAHLSSLLTKSEEDRVFSELNVRRVQVKGSFHSRRTFADHVGQSAIVSETRALPLKLLFVSPEKLVLSGRLLDTLQRLYNEIEPITGYRMLTRFVIDEAHCISQWGHDFRPEYAKLSILRNRYPETPITAVTATATRAVQEDIVKVLQLRRSIDMSAYDHCANTCGLEIPTSNDTFAMSNHSCSNTSIPELCQGHGRQWLHVPSPGTVKSTKCTPNCEILYQDSPSNRGSLDNYWGRSRRLCGYQLGNVPAYLEPYHPPSSSFLHGTQLPSMPGPLVFRQPINRPNLLLCVRPKPAKMEEAFPLVLQYLIKEQGVTLVQSSERRVSLPPPLSVIGGKKKVSQEKGAKMRRKSKGKKEKKEKAARTAGIVDTFVRNATQNNHASGNKKNTGIIYCQFRADTEALAEFLYAQGVNVLIYHAGISSSRRTLIQRLLQRHSVDVVVATLAFGMGIDIPNIRFVVHFSIPKSLECLFQEIGRAGREGGVSHALLYYNKKDIAKVRRLLYVPTKGSKGRSRKERIALGNGSLEKVVAYAENPDSKCLRKQLVEHFGFPFSEAECRNTCSSCFARNKGNALTPNNFQQSPPQRGETVYPRRAQDEQCLDQRGHFDVEEVLRISLYQSWLSTVNPGISAEVNVTNHSSQKQTNNSNSARQWTKLPTAKTSIASSGHAESKTNISKASGKKRSRRSKTSAQCPATDPTATSTTIDATPSTTTTSFTRAPLSLSPLLPPMHRVVPVVSNPLTRNEQNVLPHPEHLKMGFGVVNALGAVKHVGPKAPTKKRLRKGR